MNVVHFANFYNTNFQYAIYFYWLVKFFVNDIKNFNTIICKKNKCIYKYINKDCNNISIKNKIK